MRSYTARPLTAEAFAPYGSVLEITEALGPGRPVNMGTARRHDAVVELANLRPGAASLNVAAFRCQPRAPRKFQVIELEKHPGSSQLFVPMNATRYLVVVALGLEEPDLDTLGVFLASGRQGVAYCPGVWHQPMIVLDVETDFSCFVWEAGTPEDCVVFDLASRERVEVELG